MNDEPRMLPKPVPPIPVWPLWLSLLVPPLVVVCVTLLACLSGARRGILTFIPMSLFFPLLPFLHVFNRAVSRRYKGRSRVALGWFYFLGEAIVCFFVWLALCWVCAS